MTTLSDVRVRVQRLLNDTTGTEYPEDLLDDGIRDALFAILPWVSKPSKVDLPDVDNLGPLEFTLPVDFYRVIGVQADSGYLIPEMLFAVTQPVMKNRADNNFNLFPDGKITFADTIDDENPVVLYYGAYWPMPDPLEPTAALEPPTWTHQAIVYYTAGYALLNAASNSANVRQWNIRVDSGLPTHNPMKDMSDHYFGRFASVMNAHPAMQKGSR